MLKLPLTAESLNKVKQNIKQIAKSYQVKRFPVGQIGNIPGSRRLVESTYWPVEQAVDFFVKEGAIILITTIDHRQQLLKPLQTYLKHTT